MLSKSEELESLSESRIVDDSRSVWDVFLYVLMLILVLSPGSSDSVLIVRPAPYAPRNDDSR